MSSCLVSCDDLPSIEACIEGLEKGAKARIDNKKRKAVYLHTSGTGELCDPDVPLGTLDETVYDDADLKQIQASEWHLSRSAALSVLVS